MPSMRANARHSSPLRTDARPAKVGDKRAGGSGVFCATLLPFACLPVYKQNVNKEEALHAILAEWRRLPEPERQTEVQLVAFAMGVANNPEYSFRCSGDRYQVVMAYMGRHTSGLRKRT